MEFLYEAGHNILPTVQTFPSASSLNAEGKVFGEAKKSAVTKENIIKYLNLE